MSGQAHTLEGGTNTAHVAPHVLLNPINRATPSPTSCPASHLHASNTCFTSSPAISCLSACLPTRLSACLASQHAWRKVEMKGHRGDTLNVFYSTQQASRRLWLMGNGTLVTDSETQALAPQIMLQKCEMSHVCMLSWWRSVNLH